MPENIAPQISTTKEAVIPKLPEKYTKINQLLANKDIGNELLATIKIASQVRHIVPETKANLSTQLLNLARNLFKDHHGANHFENSSDHRKISPKFDQVSNFQTAVYDIGTKQVETDDWWIPHIQVAIAKLKKQVGIFGSFTYFSGSIFKLKQAPETKIFLLEDSNRFSINGVDIQGLQNAGYVVMGPGHSWMVPDNTMVTGVRQIPSNMSVSLSH